ncbi:receptor-interacting serine/threonine-protein kinase 3 isoform X1 [Gopherus flavomarginatus]|uniref:receptor-interacting serine/threonine-protein kinase 3 isoform X1 n=1 Tax=Gopherus flavomarginatus TaxID=286002 RepID=UPI0021CC4630|nr:receptor-interacting serine/threonine-protein kinase 3 isoform X1 [Gopherus flavomarginatus]
MAERVEFRERIPRECLEQMQVIASGGFGTIYRALHRDWRIPIAVKKLSRDTCSREELLAEARAMDKARFVYILRLFGLYEEEEEGWDSGPRLGIVMEYMENGSLATLLERVKPVPWPLRFRLLHQVALGMNYLHGLHPPLLHLDLKPSNVLLNLELHVRLADFGLSKFKRVTTKQGTERSGDEDDYGGTLEYMPPESLVDINYKPTPATDVYSYAILTWSVLTGEQPYSNLLPKCMSSLLRMHLPRGQRPNMEELKEVTGVEGLEDMKELMKRCWHNDSWERPTFKDCSNETEKIFSCHKSKILPAVRQVQDVLMMMASSPSNESRPSVSVPTPAAAESSHLHTFPPSSLGVAEQCQTLRYEDRPCREDEAVLQRNVRQTEHQQEPGTPQPCSVSMGPRQGGPNKEGEGPNKGEFGSPKTTSPQLRPPASATSLWVLRWQHKYRWALLGNTDWPQQQHESDQGASRGEEEEEEIIMAPSPLISRCVRGASQPSLPPAENPPPYLVHTTSLCGGHDEPQPPTVLSQFPAPHSPLAVGIPAPGAGISGHGGLL